MQCDKCMEIITSRQRLQRVRGPLMAIIEDGFQKYAFHRIAHPCLQGYI